MKNHRQSGLVGILALVALGLAPATLATTYQSGDSVLISPLHEIADDFYSFSGDTRVEGTITGDLVAISSETTIKGNILGSANLVGRNGDHSGSVDGSLRFFGERLTVAGRVGGSVLFFGRKLVISQGSVVEKDVNASGAVIEIGGNVLGKATCAGGTIRISGQIGGDVALKGDKIILSPPAVIRGNLEYTSENKDQLTLEPGVTVIGATTWKNPAEEKKGEHESTLLKDIACRVADFLAAFLFGVIIISLFKPYAEEAAAQLTRRSTVSASTGLLGALGLLLAVVVLALSLIGTLLGNILLSSDWAIVGVVVLVFSTLMIPISSFVTVSGAVVFYTGKIVVALVLGTLILRPMRRDIGSLNKWALLLGLVIVHIGVALPYVGLVVLLLVALVGAGAIILGVHNCRRSAEKAKAASGVN